METLLNNLQKLSLETPSTDLELIANPQTTNMNQFKAEFLQCIPEFDGNPNELNRYLLTSESIIEQFYDEKNPTNFQNTFILNSIISKLRGNAKLLVNIQNVSTWSELKTVLTNSFADQRDESCLNRDLVMLRQNLNEKPQQFFDRCLNILNLLCRNSSFNFQNSNNQLRQNSFPSQPINIQQRPIIRPQKFFTNAQVFKQPQSRNVFKPNPHRNFPRPTPMSTSTRNTNFAHPGPSTSNQNQNFQPTPMSISTRNSYLPPNSKQLFNTEVDDNPSNENGYCNYQYDEQTENDECTNCDDHTQIYQDEFDYEQNDENFQETPPPNLNT
ncbi:hypothetical protein RN001_012592 [Aquatica leii]|uniref:Gag protein n=1 Tax=Aquatica leii TaxID=1421715 RepID=A0AAN7Q1S3_9COLE|nr:hypothetical protein RN001_012592 [Aquatica leii]